MNVDKIRQARECLIEHGARRWQLHPQGQPIVLNSEQMAWFVDHLVTTHGFDAETAAIAVRLEFRSALGYRGTLVPVENRDERINVLISDRSPMVPDFVQPPSYDVRHCQHFADWETWQVVRTFRGRVDVDRHWRDRLAAEQAIQVYTAYPRTWGMKALQLAAIWRQLP